MPTARPLRPARPHPPRRACPTLALLTAVGLLTACGGSPDPVAGGDADAPAPAASSPSTSAATATATAEPVRVLASVAGQDLGVPGYGVRRVKPGDPAATAVAAAFTAAGFTLDPGAHSVLLLALGEQSTAGYAAAIEAVQRRGDVVFVQGRATAPDPTAGPARQTTRPWAAVAVPKLPAGVRLRSDVR